MQNRYGGGKSEKGKTSLCGFNLSHFSTIFMSSITYSIICLLFYWCLELIYIKITVTNNRYYLISVILDLGIMTFHCFLSIGIV